MGGGAGEQLCLFLSVRGVYRALPAMLDQKLRSMAGDCCTGGDVFLFCLSSGAILFWWNYLSSREVM